MKRIIYQKNQVTLENSQNVKNFSIQVRNQASFIKKKIEQNNDTDSETRLIRFYSKTISL